MKKNKGISLIVLVITVIIILILAGTVILSLIKNNPIGDSKEAQFKANIDAYRSELNLLTTQKYFDNYNFNPDTFDVPAWDGTGDGSDTIKETLSSITDDDAKKFKIENSRLVYVGSNELEISWLTSMGMDTVGKPLGLGVIATKNSTFDGNPADYDNPIIPKGFKAINTPDATWPTDWDEGLVIEDDNLNQFVWVPVGKDATNYKKMLDYAVYYEATEENTIDDISVLPSGVLEQTQITTYGGFYVARYEAGKDTDVVISKSGATVWTNINYTNSSVKAKEMYNTAEVKSGIMTGTQWDTIMQWISNDTVDLKDITDGSEWGNYNTYVLGLSGSNDAYKAKNIYDLAGNVLEWTSEIYDSYRVFRGGHYYDYGSIYPPSCRLYDYPTQLDICTGFRVVLFVL